MVSKPENHLFDSRLVERFVRKGVITRAQYEAHLAKLEDAAPNSETISLEIVETGEIESEALADE